MFFSVMCLSVIQAYPISTLYVSVKNKISIPLDCLNSLSNTGSQGSWEAGKLEPTPVGYSLFTSAVYYRAKTERQATIHIYSKFIITSQPNMCVVGLLEYPGTTYKTTHRKAPQSFSVATVTS